MRFVLASVLLVACSVSDKHPSTEAPPDGAGVDPTAPDTTITSGPREFANSGSSTFEFTSTDPDATFLCSIDEESPLSCTSPYTRTLSDGSHGIVIRAVSELGNADDTPAELRWAIDTVAPDTTLTENPPLADNSVDVRFDFESSEDNVTFECRVDSGEFAPCLPDDMFGPLGDGAHSFAVRAVDRAGNRDSSSATYAWAIDTTLPDTQILQAPGDISGSTSATFTFLSPDAGSGATFDCSLDGAAFTACTSPANFANLAERMHTFKVRVKDAVGNIDPTPATREWMVDLSAPETTIDAGPTGTVATASATFMFSANEDEVTFECSLDGSAFATCAAPHNVMMLSQGAHTFAVRAIDAAGHQDATPATATWTVDTASPNITITDGPAMDGTGGPFVTFTFTASEGTTECSLDAAAFAACTSPVVFNAKAGAHEFRVRANDGAGNSGLAIRSWTIECAPPVAAGAVGLFHFDDAAQTQPNGTGGADAVLGEAVAVEPADPAATPGRFGGGLAFDAGEMDRVTWPAALGPTAAFAVELWSQPGAAGTLFASGDGALTIDVVVVNATTIRYAVTVGAKTATSGEVTAGAWHHLVASLDAPMLRLWVDGVRTEVNGANAAPVLDTVTLGPFAGALDEVWVASTSVTTEADARGRYCPL